MSSPRLNNTIVLGIILLYCAGILNGIDGNFVGEKLERLLGCKVNIMFIYCLMFVIVLLTMKPECLDGLSIFYKEVLGANDPLLNVKKKKVSFDFQKKAY